MAMGNIYEGIVVSWDKAMLANQITGLHKSIEQLIKLMTDGILNQDYENLQFLFQTGAKRIEAWGNRLNLEAHEDYYKVFSYAIFWMSKKMGDKLYISQQKENETRKKYEEIKKLQNSKSITPLLELLETNGELPQGTIAERLGLSTQALSNVLRRYEEYNLWDYEKYGKYKYYHLTNDGKKYLHMMQRKKYQEHTDINHILTYFIDCFTEEICKPVPDIERIIHKMNKQFGGTQVVFGSETDKIAVRKSMRKIQNNSRRRKRFSAHYPEDDLPDVIDLYDNEYHFIKNDYYLEEQEEVCLSDFSGKI